MVSEADIVGDILLKTFHHPVRQVSSILLHGLKDIIHGDRSTQLPISSKMSSVLFLSDKLRSRYFYFAVDILTTTIRCQNKWHIDDCQIDIELYFEVIHPDSSHANIRSTLEDQDVAFSADTTHRARDLVVCIDIVVGDEEAVGLIGSDKRRTVDHRCIAYTTFETITKQPITCRDGKPTRDVDLTLI